MLDRPKTVTARAPAKLNLALHVVGRRTDGYHLLESLAVFTEHGDTLTISASARDEIVVAGRYAAQVPIDGANLVVRARDLMREHFGPVADDSVAIRLEKRLPVASGIGGGSSDAAATLRALSGFWRLDTNDAELAALGLRLGADVPMCLAARPLLARGIGDELEPLPAFPTLAVVLVNPGVPLSTGDVFSHLGSHAYAPMPRFDGTGDPGHLLDWLRDVRNDLEAPALQLVPQIGDVLLALKSSGAKLSRMSGSGATCFGLFENEEAARHAADTIARAEPAWFVAATATDAAGESHGRH